MSRIHDALKRAETERNRPDEIPMRTVAGPSDGINGDLAGLASSLFAGLATPQASDTAPLSVGLRELDRAARCNTALMERCAMFEGTLDSRTMLSSNQSSYRIGAEEFRTLRSSLELVRKQHPMKTIMVTSPLPREGKTFVAANLSQAIVWHHDQRVLLVDADLRVPSVHTCFNKMSLAPGLSDYLAGEVDPLSLLRRNEEGNFFVLSAGRQVPNALELIGNGRLKSLMDWLSPVFDWIIIDSPPCVPVSDSHLIAELCDGILFVVRAGITPSNVAKRAIADIRGNRFVGVVLNAVSPDLTASSYYYGSEQDKPRRRRRK